MLQIACFVFELTHLRGLVVMGPGAASISPSTRAAAAELFEQGVPTVITARPLTGAGVPSPNPSSVYVIASTKLNS